MSFMVLMILPALKVESFGKGFKNFGHWGIWKCECCAWFLWFCLLSKLRALEKDLKTLDIGVFGNVNVAPRVTSLMCIDRKTV